MIIIIQLGVVVDSYCGWREMVAAVRRRNTVQPDLPLALSPQPQHEASSNQLHSDKVSSVPSIYYYLNKTIILCISCYYIPGPHLHLRWLRHPHLGPRHRHRQRSRHSQAGAHRDILPAVPHQVRMRMMMIMMIIMMMMMIRLLVCALTPAYWIHKNEKMKQFVNSHITNKLFSQ